MPPPLPPWTLGSKSDDEPEPRTTALETPLGTVAGLDTRNGLAPETPLTLGAFGTTVRARIEATFGARGVWIEGEVRECVVANSGHVYFTLRDPNSTDAVRGAVWRTARVSAAERAALENGAHVIVHGKASYFPIKSEVQLIVDGVRKAGRGALLEAREKLKAKLEAEGLFAAERKRPIPLDPRIVGIVTSASGAVVHDVRTVAFQRGGARLLLSPAVVQGPKAPASLVAALTLLASVPEVDVIIFGRGGGSAEDLACFDDEGVVRAVAACKIPVVSAVGHETDVTLVDFASDARAATPSQAAEMCIPNDAARTHALADAKRRLWRGFRDRFKDAKDARNDAAERLKLVVETVREGERLVDTLDAALRERTAVELRVAQRRAGELSARLQVLHPAARLVSQQKRAHDLDTRLSRAGGRLLTDRRDRVRECASALPSLMSERVAESRESLGAAAARLDALSPLAILSRGYALVTTAQGRAVRTKDDAPVGTLVTVRAADALFDARIESVHASHVSHASHETEDP